jgi:hypothetical protein
MEEFMIEPIAVCGLDCDGCAIRRAPFDDEAAESAIAWFRQMQWLTEEEGIEEVIERGMYCQGCRGDRTLHWSADCPILICCVDERKLEFCSECDDFPCTLLTDRARENRQYAAALQRLRERQP